MPSKTPPIFAYSQALDPLLFAIGSKSLITHLVDENQNDCRYLGEFDCHVYRKGKLTKDSLVSLDSAIQAARAVIREGRALVTFHKVRVHRKPLTNVRYHILHCEGDRMCLVNPSTKNQIHTEFEISGDQIDGRWSPSSFRSQVRYMDWSSGVADTFSEAWFLFYVCQVAYGDTHPDAVGRYTSHDLFEFLRDLCARIVDNPGSDISGLFSTEGRLPFIQTLITKLRKFERSVSSASTVTRIKELETSWAFTMGALGEWFEKDENVEHIGNNRSIIFQHWLEKPSTGTVGHWGGTLGGTPVFIRTFPTQTGKPDHVYVILTEKVTPATKQRIHALLAGNGRPVASTPPQGFLYGKPHLLSGGKKYRSQKRGLHRMLGLYLASEPDLSSANELGFLKFAFAPVKRTELLNKIVEDYGNKSCDQVMTWMSRKLTWDSYRVWNAAMSQPCRWVGLKWDWNPDKAKMYCAEEWHPGTRVRKCRWGARYATGGRYTRVDYTKKCNKKNLKEIEQQKKQRNRPRR